MSEFGSYGSGATSAARSLTVNRLARDLKRDAIPILKQFGLAGTGYALTEYGGRVLLPQASPLWQGLVQGALGLVGTVAFRRLGSPNLEMVTWGGGLSGVVKLLSHIVGQFAQRT